MLPASAPQRERRMTRPWETVQLRVVRLERALFLDGVEGGPLEGWLVPFHDYL
jgi:hypothetical protein